MHPCPKPLQQREALIRRAIGARLRMFRRAAGLSMTELGKRIGVSSQQIQKYECAKNKLAASRAVLIAGELGIPLTDLVCPSLPRDEARQTTSDHHTLIAGFDALPEPLQDKLLALVKHLADS